MKVIDINTYKKRKNASVLKENINEEDNSKELKKSIKSINASLNRIKKYSKLLQEEDE